MNRSPERSLWAASLVQQLRLATGLINGATQHEISSIQTYLQSEGALSAAISCGIDGDIYRGLIHRLIQTGWQPSSGMPDVIRGGRPFPIARKHAANVAA
jgi:hypothetical protein